MRLLVIILIHSCFYHCASATPTTHKWLVVFTYLIRIVEVEDVERGPKDVYTTLRDVPRTLYQIQSNTISMRHNCHWELVVTFFCSSRYLENLLLSNLLRPSPFRIVLLRVLCKLYLAKPSESSPILCIPLVVLLALIMHCVRAIIPSSPDPYHPVLLLLSLYSLITLSRVPQNVA